MSRKEDTYQQIFLSLYYNNFVELTNPRYAFCICNLRALVLLIHINYLRFVFVVDQIAIPVLIQMEAQPQKNK